jgi:hypothetical protein
MALKSKHGAGGEYVIVGGICFVRAKEEVKSASTTSVIRGNHWQAPPWSSTHVLPRAFTSNQSAV